MANTRGKSVSHQRLHRLDEHLSTDVAQHGDNNALGYSVPLGCLRNHDPDSLYILTVDRLTDLASVWGTAPSLTPRLDKRSDTGIPSLIG
ncbi:MAG: hypothetical protein ABSG41_24620 [Bryobacteraceae bacterium]|jgi:hypothetical protein